ncbi:TPA: YitT family protein [Streptococcus pneumoniae]
MIKKIYPIFTILLGAAIYAFGLTYFVVPHHLFEGGATGITLITFYLFKIPVSLMNLLINIPLFILARILNKYTHISIGKLLFILDFCILMLILLIFKDLRLVSYTLLFDFIVSRVIDLIGEGGYAGKGFMIITKRPDQLAKAINDDLGRGVTFISGQGYYSKENLKIIYCIVGRNEIVKTKEMIHRIDPQAFITITEAHEILGEGFTFEKE